MELCITELFNQINPCLYSASQFELGDNAGKITWESANRLAESEEPLILKTEEQKDAFRAFVKDSGGWEDEEIAAWSDVELNALCLQWIAGDMREGDLHANMTDEDWLEYQNLCNEGQVSGNIFGGILSTDGEVYFSLN